jgi:hypothetical protein
MKWEASAPFSLQASERLLLPPQQKSMPASLNNDAALKSLATISPIVGSIFI